MAVHTVCLSHLSQTPVHVALFRDVKNAAFLRQQLLQGNAAFEYAFLDATAVCRHSRIHAWIFRPLLNFPSIHTQPSPCRSRVADALLSAPAALHHPCLGRCLQGAQRPPQWPPEEPQRALRDCLLAEPEQQRMSLRQSINEMQTNKHDRSPTPSGASASRIRPLPCSPSKSPPPPLPCPQTLSNRTLPTP